MLFKFVLQSRFANDIEVRILVSENSLHKDILVFVINMTLMLYYYEQTWSREYQQKQDTFCCEKWELRSTNISPAVTQYLIPL